MFCRNWCYCTTSLSAKNGGVKKQPTVLSLIQLVQGWLQVQTRHGMTSSNFHCVLSACTRPMETLKLMLEHLEAARNRSMEGIELPWCSNQVELPPPASLWKQDLPSQLYKWSLSQISPLSPLPLTFLLILSASCIDHLFYL